MKLYNAKGYLKYKNGWLVLDCDKEICRYYRFWVHKLLGKKISLPLYGAHVTVVNGKREDATKNENWGKYEGRKLYFQYSGVVFCNHEYFWIKIYCKELERIRKELKLKKMPFDFHLTIGHEARTN